MEEAGEGRARPQTKQERERSVVRCAPPMVPLPNVPLSACPSGKPLPALCQPAEATTPGQASTAPLHPAAQAVPGVTAQKLQPFELETRFYIWMGRGSAHGNEGPEQGGELPRPG